MTEEEISKLQAYLNKLGIIGSSDHDFLRKFEQELSQFDLVTETFFPENIRLEARLFFHRTPKDTYYLSKYEAFLECKDNPENNRKQTFYMIEAMITLKEAYNLLEGRAVEKQINPKSGEKFTCWLELNFDETDDRGDYRFIRYRSQYGYELDKVLTQYPIRELSNDEMRRMIIRSLQKGNIHPVTFILPTKTEKRLIAANPKMKTLKIYSVRKGAMTGEVENLGCSDLNPDEGDETIPPSECL